MWGSDHENEMTSNWKEFKNSVEALEAEAEEGHLEGAIVFLNTNSSTVDSVMYKGNSKNPLLHELVIRAKRLEIKHGAHFYVSHVSGRRMMGQGTDGLSQGFHVS